MSTIVTNNQPLYKKIKTDIIEKIQNHTYGIGDMLPSELEFQELYGVSRITVRHAISELVNEGYLSRTRGKGTIVLFKKLNENLAHFRSFTQEMLDLGMKPHTKNVSLSIVKASELVSTNLGVKKDEFILRIERLRGTKDYPVVIFDSYFALDKNLPLDKDLYNESLFEVINNYCGLDYRYNLFRYDDEFEAILADANLANQLEVKVGSPLLKRLSRTCDEQKNIFDFTICYYRADKYSCAIKYID